MAGSRQKIIETLQSVDTVLVTVGKNPTVDELSAALGLTIFLNESGKHATAVMSGDIPPAISFLEPEKTFENSVDSLRDFVIALDKDKADHLRYKLVEDVVKIYITPYRSVITEKDLRYSKGDYNVELVIAIGVKTRDDLDKALASHGRILHDATVATIGNEESKLGDPDWYDRNASSLSEMVTTLISKIPSDDKKIDKRVASSLLTGIVSATDRFSNDKTTPESLTVAAELMSYGANQQLIALKLREGSKLDIEPEDGSKKLTRDLEKENRDNRKQKDNQNQNKKQKNKDKPKDKTKFSIDHSGDKEKEEVKEESQPVETTAPNRIGLTEDGEYDPAAALDEALRISEQKRVEAINQDKDQLAEELAHGLEQSSSAQETNAPEPAQPTQEEAPAIEEAPQPETPTPGPVVEPTSEASAQEPVYELPSQNEETQPPMQTEEPVKQSVQEVESASTLPPVQSTPQIGEVRQNNAPVDKFDSDEGPAFGGVLNATTESAAEAKRLAESEMRNRTILSRSAPGASAQEEQQPNPSPFNSTMAGSEEPTMPSFEMTPPQSYIQQSQPQVFEPASNDMYQGHTIVPPTPTGTLEEIDHQHRQSVEDTEVRDMFEPSSQPLPTPSVPIGQPAGTVEAPNTPPPPPMPDFSQLPPLPTQMPDFSQVPAQMPADSPQPGPDNLGQILPPAPPAPPQSQQANDLGQFQIPNQQ